MNKKENISLSHKVFEDTSFDDISEIVIPELLLNIVSCYAFLKGKKFNTNYDMQKKFSVIFPI